MSPYCAPLVGQTLKSGYVGQGPKVDEFEEVLQRMEGVAVRLLATSCGTVALDLAFHLIGIGRGDHVVSTPATCIATNSQLLLRGADISWADVDPQSGLIDPKSVEQAVNSQTKAIVAVDWGGRRCDYMRLKSFGIPVVQDGAHSLLSRDFRGEWMGHYRMWSFQAVKHVTCGDGGALMVPKEQYERAKLLRWYGFDRTKNLSYRCEQELPEIGFKYHMNDVAATIGLSNIKSAEWILAKHRAHARFLHDNIKSRPPFVEKPPYFIGSSWWLYTLLVKARDRFEEHMKDRGIEVSPVHARNDRKLCMPDAGFTLPGVDSFCSRECNIPVGWWLTDDDLERIVKAVNEYE